MTAKKKVKPDPAKVIEIPQRPPKDIIPQLCETCKWWRLIPELAADGSAGQCRVYGPIAHETDTVMGMMPVYLGSWPITQTDHDCGEYEQADVSAWAKEDK